MSGRKLHDAPVRMVCAHCGSEDVSADAYASWNAEDQTWEVENVFEKGHYCHSCGGGCRIKEIPID